MGVRVEVRDGETIQQAFRRLRTLVSRYGSPGTGWRQTKWHKRPHDHYLKPCQLAHRVKLQKALATYLGECARRGLTPEFYHRYKWRKLPASWEEASGERVRGEPGA